MAVRALFFGVDDLFNEFRPFYETAEKRGDIEIVGFADLDKNGIFLQAARGGVDPRNFEVAIISSRNDFYNRMKFLELNGVPRNRIIDGSVFKIPNLNFSRLLTEGIAYGVFGNYFISEEIYIINPRIYGIKNNPSIIKLGTKSYITGANIDGNVSMSVKNFSCISWNINVIVGQNGDHNYKNIGIYGLTHLDWLVPPEFYPPSGQCKIEIGNDVWIGRGCRLKCNNPEKPLVIGDGAVIASDSVVVKSVPPYAIVGGNPAKFIKWRFDEKIIESLLRIKWWDWDIDKIHDNFQYFNRVEEFVEMFDK